MSSPSKVTTGKCLSNFNRTPPSHFPYFMPPSSGANNILDPWLDCLLKEKCKMDSKLKWPVQFKRFIDVRIMDGNK